MNRVIKYIAPESTVLILATPFSQNITVRRNKRSFFLKIIRMHSVHPGDVCRFGQTCPDGSYKRTCLLLSLNEEGEQTYSCSCQTSKTPQLSSVNYVWSPWYTLTDSRTGYYREIKDMLATGSPTLASEYM